MNENDFIINEETEDNCIYLTMKAGGIDIKICPSPTSNCQTASIGQFCNISNFSKEDILFMLKTLWSKTPRNQLLFDVHLSDCDKLEECFPSDVLVKQKYTNSTGSEMCLYLIYVTRTFGSI
jgi:hypothetical protein